MLTLILSVELRRKMVVKVKPPVVRGQLPPNLDMSALRSAERPSISKLCPVFSLMVGGDHLSPLIQRRYQN